MITFDRNSQSLLGLIGLVLTLALVVLGLKAAGGAYADDYTLIAKIDRVGFGLDTTSTVKVRGVTIGSVDGTRLLDDGTVEITLKIRKEVQIADTVQASVEPLSIFGPKFVQLTPGANELTGPFLTDGAVLPDAVEPSELIETLDDVSTLLSQIDADDIGIFFRELARGLDGLGDELGETVDSVGPVAEILRRNRTQIDELLVDARTLADTLDARTDTIIDTAENSAAALEGLADSSDELGELLVSTDRLATDLARVLDASTDDLGRVLNGLDPVTVLLHDQLAQVPELLDMAEGIFALIGRDLVQWDLGDGRLGGVVDGVFDLDPCVFFTVPTDCAGA